MTPEEIEALCDANDIEGATGAVKAFFDRTIRGGQHTEWRAWLALRIAVLWYNEQDSVVAQVWTMRALTEGPRADAFALLGEIALLEDDPPVAARWFQLAARTFCPGKRYLRIHAQVPARYAEFRASLFWRHVRTKSADPRHVVAVMSCPGREDLHARTLASLERGGWSRWCGPRMEIVDTARAGQAATFFRVLRETMERYADFTYLTLFENDVVVAENALDYVATTAIDEDIGLVSWFKQGAPTNSIVGAGFALERAAVFSCNQAITIPAQTVRKLLASNVLRTWDQPHLGDMIFSRVIPDEFVAYHFPNLVDHTGHGRSLAGTPFQTSAPGVSATFLGESFDALSLRAI